jgi:fermentation-respiration switch protein FrsA (DUF1100 family)
MRIRRLFGIVVGGLATAWVGACVYIKLNEPRLVFDPRPHDVAPPGDVGVPAEVVRLTPVGGGEVQAWAIPAPGAPAAAAWVLFCHGAYMHLSKAPHPEFYNELRALGVNVLAFDYRGFGDSPGQPSEAGMYADAQAAYDWLRTVRGVPAERIVIYGTSFGGAPASWLAAHNPAAGVVLDATFTSVPDVGARRYPLLPIRALAANRFDTHARLDSIAEPKLVIHGRADALVPFDMGERNFADAPAPKRWLEVQGEHAMAFQQDSATYWTGLREWLVREARVLPAR